MFKTIDMIIIFMYLQQGESPVQIPILKSFFPSVNISDILLYYTDYSYFYVYNTFYTDQGRY